MITKTDFLQYLDAPLHLWAREHDQLEVVLPTAYERHLMDQGQEIEVLAGAYLQEHLGTQLLNPQLEFQRTFTDGRFQARADVVVYDPGNQVYDIYEIKSSTSVKKEHQYDVAFQRLVCEASIPVRSIYILHVNKDYVRGDELDLNQLFTAVNMDGQAAKLRQEVLTSREAAWGVVTSPEPIGIQACGKPKVCPCLQLCHPDLPEYPIYDLTRLGTNKTQDLIAKGILSISDIPEGYPLSPKQNRQVEAVKTGKPFVDRAAIQAQLDSLEYPLYFLDYETYNPGVPFYAGYRPYQHIVFQYSLHALESPDSELMHFEYLALDPGELGGTLLERLASQIGSSGTVIVWNKVFEAGRNKELAEMVPAYCRFLLDLNDRIYDLMVPFSQGYYVHRDFHGSASIKKVLPVMAADFDLQYDQLPIPKGDEAMLAWARIMSGELTPEEVEQTKDDLLRYCELDTLAMVKNWEALGRLDLGKKTRLKTKEIP